VEWGATVANISQADAARPEEWRSTERGEGMVAGRGGEGGWGGVGGMELGRHVRVELSDGRQFAGHCCIGSDGIHSKSRPKILGHTSPLRYLGYIVVLGIFKNSKFPLSRRRMFQTSDGAARMFAMPFTEHQSMWQLSWKMEEEEALKLSLDGAALRTAALQVCKGWHDPITQIIEKSDFEHHVSGYPAYDRPPATAHELRPAALSLCCVLGDAAHPMSPFKGQGANQALLDGLMLSEALHRYLSIDRSSWIQARKHNVARLRISLPWPNTGRPDFGLPRQSVGRGIGAGAVGEVMLPGETEGGESGKGGMDGAEDGGDQRDLSSAMERESEWVSGRIEEALRAFEAEMSARTARKVELSHESIADLHRPEYTNPQFHAERGAQNLDKVLSLRCAGVSAAAADVADDHLEVMMWGGGGGGDVGRR
jgi:hypothetical protein